MIYAMATHEMNEARTAVVYRARIYSASFVRMGDRTHSTRDAALAEAQRMLTAPQKP